MVPVAETVTQTQKLADVTPAGFRWTSFVSAQKLDVGIATKDEDIRERLFSYTPKGFDATNVLKFVVDDLHPKGIPLSYFAYVDVLQAGRSGRLNVMPEGEEPSVIAPMHPEWTPRFIFLVIGTYSNADVFGRITVNWKFDKNDKLVDIIVGRENTGFVASIANDSAGYKIADQIASMLKQAGINDYIIAGSERLDIVVSPSERAEVTRLLKKDAQIHNYENEITFY